VIALRPGVVLVDVVRSDIVESVHSGHVVILDGDDVIELGDPHQPLFPRSSNKPLQAVGMRQLGLDGPRRNCIGRGVAFGRTQQSGRLRDAGVRRIR